MIVSVLLAGYSAKAQGFYAELNFGYGLGMPSTQLGTETYMDLAGSGSYTKPLYGTLGSGLNITLTPGYMFSEHIGGELGINYFMGNETEVSTTTTSMSNIYDKSTAKSSQLRLLPSLIFSTGGDKLYGYAKTGLVIPVSGSTTGKRDVSTMVGANTVTTEVETTSKGYASLGFRGSLGVGYNFTDMIGLTLEVYHTSLTIKSKTRTIDSYTAGGVDMMPFLTEYDKETNYVEELNSSSNNSSTNSDYSTSSAKDEIAGKSNFNQFGVALGVKFRF